MSTLKLKEISFIDSFLFYFSINTVEIVFVTIFSDSFNTMIVGNYLGGEFSVAFDVIAKFFEGVTNEKIMKTAEEKHAESELILFQNRCLEKQKIGRAHV